jgi:hypothetical protein
LVASPCLSLVRLLVAQEGFFRRSLILNALAFKINERPENLLKHAFLRSLPLPQAGKNSEYHAKMAILDYTHPSIT